MSQATQLADLTDQVKAGLKKVYSILLRQRRRATEAMSQEIKELTQVNSTPVTSETRGAPAAETL